MIVGWDELPSLAGKTVMVDGSFDPLHDGHIAYFRAAFQIGLPVLCNLSSDRVTELKHPVLLPQAQRSEVLDVIRYITYVHPSQNSTRDVLEQLRPSVYAKGDDWRERGGVPLEEQQTCERFGIRIVYLNTVLNSSTRLIEGLRRL